MDDFLAFRKMLTPVIIQVVFWLGLIGVAVWGWQSADGGILGVLMIVVGAVMWRVYCEILIVIFRILDVLTDIRRGVGGDK
jgi:hypothetical protein